MTLSTDRIIQLLGNFASPQRRRDAYRQVADLLGVAEVWLLTPDPELDIRLPAPGLPQTLRMAREWRTLVARCLEAGAATGELQAGDGTVLPARATLLPDTSVVVLLGETVADLDVDALAGVFTLLAQLATDERRVRMAEVRASEALDAARRADALADALRVMRDRLAAALREASEARAAAHAHALQAEALAEELQTQARHLEEQASELEMLNTELAERSAEAENARQVAEKADHAKSEFLAMMSHELRTPMNAIIGYAQLLEIQTTDSLNKEQKEHLARIQTSSHHLLTLINDVLDLAKIEAGEMTVDVESQRASIALREAVSMVKLQSQAAGIELEDTCSNHEYSYIGDENRVRQILTNLLSNAVKFTPANGRVVLRCDAANSAPHDQDGNAGPWLRIDVEDNGIGMTAADLQKVFRPFVQAEMGRRRSRAGTGLGLTISRQLARLMGGELTARSEVGRGSCFTLWLPTRPVPAGRVDEDLRVGANPAQASV